MDLLDKTKKHLQNLEQIPLCFEKRSFSSLPLILRQRYQIYAVKFFSRSWLLALESAGWDSCSPGDYRKHLEQLSFAAGTNSVVFVLPFITSTIRNRMVQMNIPFIIPGVQIFLPLYMVNLQETGGAPTPLQGKPLKPSAQALLLSQLLKGNIKRLSTKEIAEKLSYSTASVSNACTQLRNNDLCESYRKGKEVRLKFPDDAHDIWKRALPYLKSPVKQRMLVKMGSGEDIPQGKLAGISALSLKSNLADDELPTLALERRVVDSGLMQGWLKKVVDRYDADAVIESWKYNPALISDDVAVDPLSLYLSLRDNLDERVQSELSSMMEGVSWQ